MFKPANPELPYANELPYAVELPLEDELLPEIEFEWWSCYPNMKGHTEQVDVIPDTEILSDIFSSGLFQSLIGAPEVQYMIGPPLTPAQQAVADADYRRKISTNPDNMRSSEIAGWALEPQLQSNTFQPAIAAPDVPLMIGPPLTPAQQAEANSDYRRKISTNPDNMRSSEFAGQWQPPSQYQQGNRNGWGENEPPLAIGHDFFTNRKWFNIL